MELDDTFLVFLGGLSHNHNLRTFSTIRDMEVIHRDEALKMTLHFLKQMLRLDCCLQIYIFMYGKIFCVLSHFLFTIQNFIRINIISNLKFFHFSISDCIFSSKKHLQSLQPAENLQINGLKNSSKISKASESEEEFANRLITNLTKFHSFLKQLFTSSAKAFIT